MPKRQRQTGPARPPTSKKTRSSRSSTATTPPPDAPLSAPVQETAQISDAIAAAVQAAIPTIVHQVHQLQANQTVSDGLPQTQSTETIPLSDHITHLTGESDSDPINPDDLLDFDYDEGVPVDHHLTDRQRQMILSHQYIDFRSLIKKPKSVRKKTLSFNVDSNDNIVVEQDDGSASMSITAWLSAFTIYSTAYCRQYPKQSVGLFHYMDHIRQMKDNGFDWLKYDESFRKIRSSNVAKYPFHKDLVQLQMKCTQIPQPNAQSFGNKTNRPSQPSSKSSRAPGQSTPTPPPYPYGTCWMYQNGAHCDGNCRWPDTHQCCYCFGKHPAVRCNQKSQGPQHSQTQQPTASKEKQPRRKSKDSMATSSQA